MLIRTVPKHKFFSDASFATNKDLSSQRGYVILLVDSNGNYSILNWTSMNCKRVTRSVIPAELYALHHAFDTGFAICHTISQISGRKVNIHLFTDSLTLFDSVVSLCSLAEKRLLTDIYGLRQPYRTGELSKICWIRAQYNLADALTKDFCQNFLHDVRRTHSIHTPVSQWVTQGLIPSHKNEIAGGTLIPIPIRVPEGISMIIMEIMPLIS